MTQWKKNSIHTVQITGYTAEGMGVARLDGLVLFIPNTIQGETWEIQLLKVTKHVAWARGIHLLTPSPARIDSDCPYSAKCGGCQYRHMSYEEELSAKRQKVQDALTRLGGLSLEIPPVLGAVSPLRYRNKVQFPVSQTKHGLAIGFYRPRSHDVIDTTDCMLQPEPVTQLRHAFKTWMETYQIPAYEEATCSGLVRHFYVRTNQNGQALACIVVNGHKIPHQSALIKSLCGAYPALLGIVLNCNTKDTNVILGERYETLWGQSYLEETLCGMSFRLSVPSFFQINHPQTERLYQIALDFAQLTGTETVLDLYCGIGTISLALAQKAKTVIGCEIVPEAIEDANANAKRNGISNTQFFCGDTGEIAAKLAQDGITPDVVCVDPPRKGLAPEVPEILTSMQPKRIVYVSCDPATLARDVKRLATLGYQVHKIQAVDLFPRTAHVETVVQLFKDHSTVE